MCKHEFDDEVEYEFDEVDEEATKRISRETDRVRAFLKDYVKLCKKHGCLVLSEGEAVEAFAHRKLAEEEDPWGVVERTKSRGWKL